MIQNRDLTSLKACPDDALNSSVPRGVPGFLYDSGERVHCSLTLLGAAERWPQSLKTLVGVLLTANQPMFIAGRAQRTLLYNDGYAEVLADKHPSSLGGDFLGIWSGIRGDLVPIVDQAYAGKPFTSTTSNSSCSARATPRRRISPSRTRRCATRRARARASSARAWRQPNRCSPSAGGWRPRRASGACSNSPEHTFEFADAACSVRPDLAVLFITAYAENAVLSPGHLDPGVHVLIKPFAMDVLATNITGLIEG